MESIDRLDTVHKYIVSKIDRKERSIMSILRKNLAVGTAIGLVIGLVSVYSIWLGNTTSLEKRISELEGQVVDLQYAVVNKNTEIAGLQSHISLTDIDVP